MRKIIWILLFVVLMCGCTNVVEDQKINAFEYGLHPDNSGTQNSRILQHLIDDLSETGGAIYIPEGEYLFAENGRQTIGSHCVKMRSNVSIIGAGEKTILKPVGESDYGLDMFYFNELLDFGNAAYLENCNFRDFVIDASGTSCKTYTSAGKGFMFNLFRNCHWENVTVMNTDATGFGVDCPFESTITNCVAVGCGKAATQSDTGASGFGIGYGYAPGENLQIQNCVARDNTKFGFFIEHQGRFDPTRYPEENQGHFLVTDCNAQGNLYNFGGICAENVTYRTCISLKPRGEAVYFEDCSNCLFIEDPN